MGQVIANSNIGCLDVGMSSLPSNKAISSFLVHFLLLLAIETFNVSEDMIFKCVSFVQSLTLDVFMCACLPSPEVIPFVHF